METTMRLCISLAIILFITTIICGICGYPILETKYDQTNNMLNFDQDYKQNILSNLAGEPIVMTDPTNPSRMLMWYNNQSDKRPWYAYSSDGLHWTARVTSITHAVQRLGAVYDEGTFYLYGTAPTDLYMHVYTSKDRINFIDRGIAISYDPKGWDSTGVSNNFEWRAPNGTYYMLYEGISNGIGLASSTDLINWTKYGKVYNNVSGSGNPELMRFPNNTVYQDSAGKYYMYLHYDGGESAIASSTDLIKWTDIGKINHPGCTGNICQGSDASFIQFGAKAYMFTTPSDQISVGWIDVYVSKDKPIEPPMTGSIRTGINTTQRRQLWQTRLKTDSSRTIFFSEHRQSTPGYVGSFQRS